MQVDDGVRHEIQGCNWFACMSDFVIRCLCLCCRVPLCREFDGIVLDYSRQRVQEETMKQLFELAEVGFDPPLHVLNSAAMRIEQVITFVL